MIFAPETWKEVSGVTFLYWDRWFLRLAVDERDGLEGLVGRFKADRKHRRASHERRDAEAKLAHLDDLRVRLAKVGMTAHEVLGEADAADKKLLAKSQTKLIEQSLLRKSTAMLNTQRHRLEARALRGHWGAFPVSPARFEDELMRGHDRNAYYDWRVTTWFADDLDAHRDVLSRLATSEAEQLALYRAALTVIVESMERTDDSHASLAMVFEDVWNAYLAMPWERTGIPASAFFRDLIELTVWENYGLIDGLTDFLRSLALDDAAVVESVFAEVIPELRDGDFDHQEEKALRLRVDFLIGQRLHDRFVDAAFELGSRAWMPIVAMGQAALDARKRTLAMSVFSAADQPGMQRDYLRQECVKMLGETVRPRLRRVR